MNNINLKSAALPNDFILSGDDELPLPILLLIITVAWVHRLKQPMSKSDRLLRGYIERVVHSNNQPMEFDPFTLDSLLTRDQYNQ